MAGEEADAEDRTEAASPERLRRAREEGDVALSREAVHFAALGGAVLALATLSPAAGEAFAGAAQAVLLGSAELQPGEAMLMLLGAVAPLALGTAAAAALCAAAATLLQTGFLVRAESLMPQAGRVNPMSGLQRMFGMPTLEEALRTLLKLAVVGGAVWLSVAKPAVILDGLSLSAAELAARIPALLAHLLTTVLAASAALAGLDLLWVRLRHARKLRMSRQDMKEEAKDQEGDPHLRARRRQIAQQRGRRRTLAAVSTATVVVTNPTHYAVALAYERGRDAAPRVVAKGVDSLAARIRAEADRHGVPILPNPPLARALFRLPEDREIPAEMFKAVAEVIAVVMRLRAASGRG
jgi:flagellar biosynthetic protein FlhB